MSQPVNKTKMSTNHSSIIPHEFELILLFFCHINIYYIEVYTVLFIYKLNFGDTNQSVEQKEAKFLRFPQVKLD